MRSRILIIDDNPQTATEVKATLARKGATVVVEQEISRGLDRLTTEPIDILFTNRRAQGRDEWEVLRRARERQPTVPVIVIAGPGSLDSMIEAFRLGAVDYLATPLQAAQVFAAFAKAIAKLPPYAPETHSKCCNVIGSNSTSIVAASPSMRHLTQTCTRMATLAVPIFVVGETGVGKQKIVRLIHSLSSRRDEPFVTVNCDAMQESQLVKTFFGHEDRDLEKRSPRVGLIERAAGGTLLLRNITGLPRWMQEELYQAAQSGGFHRSGGSELIPFRARLAASTTYLPADSIRQGVLLQDLHCYLGACMLNVPALRNRREDIRPLVESLTCDISAEMSPLATRPFSEEALVALESYDWPGNIHELGNFIRRVFVFSTETQITAAHVNEYLNSPFRLRRMNTITVPFVGDLKLIQRAIVNEVINRSHGNKSAAARTLGMHRKTLYRIITEQANRR